MSVDVSILSRAFGNRGGLYSVQLDDEVSANVVVVFGVILGVDAVQPICRQGKIRRGQLFAVSIQARQDASGAVLGSCLRFLGLELASPLVDEFFVS